MTMQVMDLMNYNSQTILNAVMGHEKTELYTKLGTHRFTIKVVYHSKRASDFLNQS